MITTFTGSEDILVGSGTNIDLNPALLRFFVSRNTLASVDRLFRS